MAAKAAHVLAAANFDTFTPDPSPPNGRPSLRFAVSKPSWVVRTESNVWKEVKRKPSPPCVACGGNGRVDCHQCAGRGLWYHHRVRETAAYMQDKLCKFSNASERRMAKVVRCKTCGGSGLDYCSRCLGTGEYRDRMGFHFMKVDNNPRRDNAENESSE